MTLDLIETQMPSGKICECPKNLADKLKSSDFRQDLMHQTQNIARRTEKDMNEIADHPEFPVSADFRVYVSHSPGQET